MTTGFKIETSEQHTQDEPVFKAFSKIPRLRRDCVITLKLDGTNALVFVGENGTVRAGSRTRWLSPDDDNHGFARWVAEHADELRTLGPGYHYGEWFGQGIQKRHHASEKAFALFNVARWGDDGTGKRPACCLVAPVLYRGPFSDEAVDTVIKALRENGHPLVPNSHKPEGVIIWHEAAQQLFKVTLEKDSERKNPTPTPIVEATPHRSDVVGDGVWDDTATIQARM